jgi:hypothetical protein
LEWTESIEDYIRESWENKINGADYRDSINLDGFCDCLIEEFKRYPIKKIYSTSDESRKLVNKIILECGIRNNKSYK